MIDRLSKGADWLCRLISFIGLMGLLALACAVVMDVLMRWLFNSPIEGVRDTSSLFVSVVIACAFPVSLIEESHITIKVLGKVLGRVPRLGLTIFGHLVTLALFALIAWQLWEYTDHVAAEGQATLVLGWPAAPWWRGISIIVGFCVPIQLLVLIKALVPPPDQTAAPAGER